MSEPRLARPSELVDYSAKLLRGSAARVVTTLVSIATTFFLTPFVVRTLSDHWYGLWVVISGFAAYYYLLDFGISSAVNQYITAAVARRDSERVNQVVSTAVALFAGLGSAVFALVGAVWIGVPWFVAPGDVASVRLVVLLQGFSLGLGFPFKAFGGVVLAHIRYDLIEAISLTLLLSQAGLTVLVLKSGGGIVALASVAFVAVQVHNLAFYLLAKRLWPTLSIRIHCVRRAVAREMFGYGLWSFVNQFSDMVRFRVDSLVVGGFCGASVVTHYAIGASLAEYGLNLTNRATNILTPVFVRYEAEGDRAAIRSKLLFFTKVNAILSTFGFGLLFVLGRHFIVRWMGPSYADSYVVFVVMGAALMMEALMQTANNALYGLARHRPYAIAAVCEAVANAALSIVLARRYGMVGVAVGTAIPLAVNKLLFTPYYTSRVVGVPLRQFYAPIVRAASVTAGVLLLVWAAVAAFHVAATYSSIVLVSCLAVATYVPVAFYGILTADERVTACRLVPLPRWLDRRTPAEGASR